MRLKPLGSQKTYERAYERNDIRKLKNKEKYEGEKFKSNHGNYFTIKEYIGVHNVICEYDFSGVIREYRLINILSGAVQDPFYRENNHHKAFVFENPTDEFIGRTFINSQGDKFKIIEYRKYKDITIQFLDPPYYNRKTTYRDAESGSLDNPYHKNELGGYLGEDKRFRGNEFRFIYNIWYKMLFRVSEQGKIKYPAYSDCFVCQEWYNYSNFINDYMNKFIVLNPNIKYNIDKDLLYPLYKQSTNGYKLYSNNTTVLLPEEINQHFVTINPYTYKNNMRKDRYNSLLNKLEIYWKNRFKEYLNINAITIDIYNILEQLRIEKINIMKNL